jgi:hypothetical protein
LFLISFQRTFSGNVKFRLSIRAFSNIVGVASPCISVAIKINLMHPSPVRRGAGGEVKKVWLI